MVLISRWCPKVQKKGKGFSFLDMEPIVKMGMLCFLVLSLIPSRLGANASSRPPVVNIGALLASDSVIGRIAKIAIDAAVNDVNSDQTVLPGTKLVVQMQDTNCSGSIGVIEALQFMRSGIVATIGPQSSVIAHVISYVAQAYQLPLLSFAATDPTLRSPQYPFFVRTTQSDQFQMTAVAEIVKYYMWRQVIAVYVDDDYGRNGMTALGDKFTDRGIKISHKVPLQPEATTEEVTDMLVKVAMVGTRIIVLHAHARMGLRVLSVARHLRMVSSGFVWIATDWLSTLLDSSASLDAGTMITMQGVLTLRQHTADSKNKSTLFSNWKNLKKNGTDQNLRLNSYGLYAYDTVWIIAHALDAFFTDNGTISFSNNSMLQKVEGGGPLYPQAMTVFNGGKLLLDKILKSDFMGVTGPVQFDNARHLINPAYDILNIVGTGFRTVGYWSNYSGLSVLSPEALYPKPANHSSGSQQLYSVIWPGDTATKPRGWVFPNNGKELKIGVPDRVFFKEFVAKDPKTGSMKGYCIDVFIAALNMLPYPVPYRFVPFGNGIDNPSYNVLIDMVASNVYDAAVGDVTIVTNRTKIVDFTQPFVESGLAIMAPVHDASSNAWAFLQPFTVQMWCVTGLSFLVVGAVVWILEHKFNDEFRGPPQKQICTVFWFSFSTLFFSQKENTVSTLGRAVLIIWLFVVLIIQSSYTASLTSILTVKQLSSPIKGIGSLISSKDPIGFQTGSFVENYLSEELGIAKSRLKPLESREDYVRALDLGPKNGGVAAVVDERPYIELFMSTQCKYSIVGSDFTRSGWGFAFQKDSPLAIDLSTSILTLSENGDLQKIHDEWLSSSGCSSMSTDLSSDQLHISSFSGLFLICGLACIVALLIYFFLMLRQFLQHFPSEEPDPAIQGSSRGRVVQTFLSFVDEKEEDAKSRTKRKQLQIQNMSYNNIESKQYNTTPYSVRSVNPSDWGRYNSVNSSA